MVDSTVPTARVSAAAARTRVGLWRLVRETVSTCFRYRVTGLAAEAGFFALLSLPPLILGMVGTLGYLDDVVGAETVERIQQRIVEIASETLSSGSVRDVIVPTLNDVLRNGRIDLMSVGFVLSLWSGSRALNVYIDTISIMYGLSGHRGIIRTRALSFSLYVVGLVISIVVVPLVVAGPTLVDRALPERADIISVLYWPLTVLLSVAFLTSLYHVSVPVRTAWVRDIPGAILALIIWFGGSYVVRWVLGMSVGGPSVYGPLAAPIVVLVWLYVLAISVLIGAALNSSIDRLWPVHTTSLARRLLRARKPGRRTARNRDDTGESGTTAANSPAVDEATTENAVTPVRPRG